MIKIAYVINYIAKNGPSCVVSNIISSLPCDSYEITLITLFDGNDPAIIDELKKQGITVYECSTLSRMNCVIGRDTQFDEIVSAGRFDILHSHGFVPDILTSRIQFPMKKVSTIHNNMFDDYTNQYGLLKGKLCSLIHTLALKKFDHCVCCSKSVYDAMKHYTPAGSYIRNGIRQESAKKQITRAALNIPQDARLFIFAGSFTHGKNIQNLMLNFAKYRHDNEYLVLLGSGPEEDNCRKLSNDHVRMLGFQSDPISYFNISDVYISASKSEGLSISAIEAMSCGLGLFLSDIPSHRELIKLGIENELGCCFSDDNFRERLEFLRGIRFDAEKIRALQKKELSDVHMADQYNRLYLKLLGISGSCEVHQQ